MTSTNQPNNGVIILGAGLAGLGCARELPGSRIFEAKKYAGGHAYSHPSDGFSFDEGAHICHAKDQAYLDLIFKAAGEVNHIANSRVLNRYGENWITYPVQNNLRELPSRERVQALTGFVRAQIERAAVVPRHYLDWCLNQYGEYLTDKFYAVYTAKYWRTPMDQLGTDWLSGRLLPAQVERVITGAIEAHADDQAVFSAFHYPKRGGYFSFYKGLYDELDITVNAQATEVDAKHRTVSFAAGSRQSYDELVSTIPLPNLVAMTKDVPASVRDAARQLRHTQLICVNIVINRPKLTDLHWFYIYNQEIEASRVSVVSNLGQEQAAQQQTALQAEIFRRPDEAFDTDQLVENTVLQLGRVLKFDRVEIVSAKPVVVPHAYIVSDLQRAAAVQHIHEWMTQQRIHCAGLLGKWKFIWSDAAFRDGVATAQFIRQSKA